MTKYTYIFIIVFSLSTISIGVKTDMLINRNKENLIRVTDIDEYDILKDYEDETIEEELEKNNDYLKI